MTREYKYKFFVYGNYPSFFINKDRDILTVTYEFVPRVTNLENKKLLHYRIFTSDIIAYVRHYGFEVVEILEETKELFNLDPARTKGRWVFRLEQPIEEFTLEEYKKMDPFIINKKRKKVTEI